MKAKKFFAVALSLAIAATAAIGIAACGGKDDDGHVHNYSEWGQSETEHWKYCKDDNTINEKSRGEHNFVGDTCSECGYTKGGSSVTPADPDLDTRDLYVLGAGIGTLKSANWTNALSSIKLDKELDENKNTVYTVELELYFGDEFKILEPSAMKKDADGNDAWDDTLQFLFADLDLSAVTTVTEPFSDVQTNIHVNQGADGIYKFTITTQKDGVLKANKVKVELIDKKDAMDVTQQFDMYIVGTVASKGTCNWPSLCGVAAVPTNCIKMTYDATTQTFSVDVKLTTSDRFKVWNYKQGDVNGGYYPTGTGNDLKVDAAGTYTVAWHVGADTPTITLVPEA